MVQDRPRPTTQRRAELYLGRAIALIGNRLVGRIQANHPALRVASWSYDGDDAVALADYLMHFGAFDITINGHDRQLTAKAHILLDEWSPRRTSLSQAFVAVGSEPPMVLAFDQEFSKAISASGYEPVCVDRTGFNGATNDQIIAEIRRSAFVVADLTGHPGNVYYEAGFAHGLGRSVIFTCRKDEIKDLRFDVRQYLNAHGN